MAKENDIVLVYHKERPVVFARIEEILPDHKPDWYHVKLLMLQVPVQLVTWILRDVYINGEEFTMNGERIRLELVVSPEQSKKTADQIAPGEKTPDLSRAEVISLRDHKKE